VALAVATHAGGIVGAAARCLIVLLALPLRAHAEKDESESRLR
jgi:hypothetical protein